MKIVCIVVVCCTLGLGLATPSEDKYDCGYCQPEQIHIAFGEKSNDIVITWSTFDNPKSSIVKYGKQDMATQVQGTRTKFVDGGTLKRTQFIHRVTLKDLKFDTKYMYHVGSLYGWSEKFTFKTPPRGEDWVVRAAIYGDMGMKNSHALPYLQEDTENEKYDLVLHVGDFAYDMDTDDALVGDQFMRQIQPIAASLPYMVCPGNHEEKYNFSNYKNRFSMPGGEESMFYSFDLGPVHFVSISTEFYYYINYGLKMVANQYEWLVKDLEEANQKENRQKRPWIIVYGHRPMYCSNLNNDGECPENFPARKGLPILGFGLEPLLQQYGVDLVIWAHEHSYERTWPLYDEKVYNGSLQQPYHNPGAPVHIITGSAGCQEGNDGFVPNPNSWSAFRAKDYGYTRLAALNRTHVYIDQVSVVKNPPEVIDQVWLVKDNHGPYLNLV